MPQLDFVEQGWQFTSQLFWLLISFGFLYVLMARIALPRIAVILDERSTRIEKDLEVARLLKEETEGVIAAYEEALEKARDHAREVIATMEAENKKAFAERQERLSAELNRQADQARLRIEQAQKEAVARIEDVASDVAAEVYSKLVKEKITPQDVKQAISKTMNEAA